MQDDANFGRVCNYAGLHDDGELSMASPLSEGVLCFAFLVIPSRDLSLWGAGGQYASANLTVVHTVEEKRMCFGN